MIIIIRVVNHKTQIPNIERTVGCLGDNETQIRTFIVPRYIDGSDIDLSTYTAKIEIQPVNKEHLSYYNLLSTSHDDESIILVWTIKSYDTVLDGKLYFNLHFSKDSGDTVPVYQTQMDYFIVAPSVNAEQQSEIIPPSIFEQAVIEATKQADLAKQYRDEIIDKTGNLDDLETEQKLDIVSSINELVDKINLIQQTIDELIIPDNYQFLIVPKD